MLNLIDEAKLSDIPEVSDEEVATYSNESLEVAPAKNDGDVTADDSARMQSPNNISYTITALPSGEGKMVTFYLNVLNLLSQSINQFVMLCDCLLTEKDVLFVHFNSMLYCEEAETIYNAIYDCKAKKKIGSAPYTLNTAALFPILACDYMIGCPWCFAHFDVPSIKGGGIGHKDAKNSFAYDNARKFRMLDMLRDKGFIPAEAYEHITENQGSYTLCGPKYVKVIEAFNSK